MPPNECVSSHFIRDLTVYKHIYVYIRIYIYIYSNYKRIQLNRVYFFFFEIVNCYKVIFMLLLHY